MWMRAGMPHACTGAHALKYLFPVCMLMATCSGCRTAISYLHAECIFLGTFHTFLLIMMPASFARLRPWRSSLQDGVQRNW